MPTLLLVVVAAVAAGCRVAPARVHNLEELHHPDGTPRGRGELYGDLGYFLAQLGSKTSYGGGGGEGRGEERISDPLGTCLDNVIALGDCDRDEAVAGLQAATFAWLAVDCTYALSRERCVFELGDLATELVLPAGSGVVPDGPAGPDAVAQAYDDLVAAARGVIAAPGLGTRELEQACERILALPLEREGALRLLRASNSVLAGRGADASFAAVRALRLDLARRCTALALRAALGDTTGMVRAAALRSCVRAFPDERAELLRSAMVDPMEDVADRTEVSRTAVELIARYGLPPAPEGVDPEEYERSWRLLLFQILRLQIDGPHTVGACRALARITGEEPTLRSEVWLARARAEEAAREGAARP